jgi:peroxiredoxin (alkyl hydroperoxide reductase subunit C)
MLIVMIFSLTGLWSQDVRSRSQSASSEEDRNFRIPLIGEKAPEFSALTTNGPVTFPNDYGLSWKILFAHPQDFTPVCSSEILELANLQKEFDKLGVRLFVVSTDPIETHEQWKKALEEVDFKGRERTKIRFPLAEDRNLEASAKYGMLHASSNSTRYVRGVFIIDPSNIIRAIYFYPLEVGRSTAELIRTVSALKTVDRTAMMTPAEWLPGEDLIVPFLPSSAGPKGADIPAGYYSLAWFMMYKKAID